MKERLKNKKQKVADVHVHYVRSILAYSTRGYTLDRSSFYYRVKSALQQLIHSDLIV